MKNPERLRPVKSVYVNLFWIMLLVTSFFVIGPWNFDKGLLHSTFGMMLILETVFVIPSVFAEGISRSRIMEIETKSKRRKICVLVFLSLSFVGAVYCGHEIVEFFGCSPELNNLISCAVALALFFVSVFWFPKLITAVVNEFVDFENRDDFPAISVVSSLMLLTGALVLLTNVWFAGSFLE